MNDAAAIGAQLLAARERLGMTVEQAAESMHVNNSIIESLEAGRFFALGAPVFARGYLRQYAEILGEPLEEVTGRYMTLEESGASPDISAVPRLAAKARARRLRGPLVIIAALLILVVLIWWAMGVKTA
jgi:cytoskeleton protein RodZ